MNGTLGTAIYYRTFVSTARSGILLPGSFLNLIKRYKLYILEDILLDGAKLRQIFGYDLCLWPVPAYGSMWRL